jgi:hypothetical protein
MDDISIPKFLDLPPSNPRECVTGEGYEICFYPGFVRRLTLVTGGGETLLYEQSGPFILPPGQLKPWPSSTLEVRGNGASVMLQLNDPGQQVDRIEIVLKARDGEGNEVRLVIEDGPVLCPPFCPER